MLTRPDDVSDSDLNLTQKDSISGGPEAWLVAVTFDLVTTTEVDLVYQVTGE